MQFKNHYTRLLTKKNAIFFLIFLIICSLTVLLLREWQSDKDMFEETITVETTVSITKISDFDTVQTAEGESIRLLGIASLDEIVSGMDEICFNRDTIQQSLQNLLLKRAFETASYSELQKDSQGNTLRILQENQKNINLEIIRSGLSAFSSTFVPSGTQLYDTMLQAQQEARNANRGIWAPCSSDVA
ncbi:MAG: thermonuclease family protein [Candidatus Dojkabacteria bacterium]